MQDLSAWERSYSVGNWMLDNQHRNLLIVCQQTIDRIADELSFQSLGDELLTLAAEHFSAEEKVLEITGYASLAEHSEEHRRSLNALERMLNHVSSGLAAPQELSDFLPGWCMGHILEADRQFSSSIQRRR